MEEDDEGWDIEDEIEALAEGDGEILAEGRVLLALEDNASIPRTPRTRFQNLNHPRTT
jgi:hypothetical protein